MSSSSPARGSPVKGRKSKSEIRKKKKRLPFGWYIRSALVQGNFDVIFILRNDEVNDGYCHKTINDALKADLEPFVDLGVLGFFRMRTSLDNPNTLFNMDSAKSEYARRVLIRMLDDHETTEEERLAGLRRIKEFLDKRENNEYETPVFIEEDGWDLTPKLPSPLKRLDSYLLYEEIKKLIYRLFAGVNKSWAKYNPDSAACFFTPGYIPEQAAKDLGYDLALNHPDESVGSESNEVKTGEGNEVKTGRKRKGSPAAPKGKLAKN